MIGRSRFLKDFRLKRTSSIPQKSVDHQIAGVTGVKAIPWGWRTMWVIAMFDLPTDTAHVRKAYARFRKDLLNDGFTMMQYH